MFFVPIPRAIAKERGLKHYFTNKPCSRGNFANKTLAYKCTCLDCKEDNRLRSLEYSRNNPEKARERARIWLANNQERNRISSSNYYHSNKEACANRQKEWYENNKEQVKKYAKKHYQCNKDRHSRLNKLWIERNKEQYSLYKKSWDLTNLKELRLSKKKWRENNKDSVRAFASTRRATQRSSRVLFDELSNFVLKEAMSLNILREKVTAFRWHVDHMIPLQNSNVCGLHVWNNFQCLPSVMNTSKGNKLIYTNPHEWLYDIPKFFKVVYQKEIAT